MVTTNPLIIYVGIYDTPPAYRIYFVLHVDKKLNFYLLNQNLRIIITSRDNKGRTIIEEIFASVGTSVNSSEIMIAPPHVYGVSIDGVDRRVPLIITVVDSSELPVGISGNVHCDLVYT